MPSRGRQQVEPVIIEVRPDNVGSKVNIAPASPSSSPKAVRFAEDALFKTGARPLTQTEAWSLYHFENHARQCRRCYEPYEVLVNGERLCSTGHALAQDVAVHVYDRDGDVYSCKTDNHKHVRVEMPPDYDHLRGLLKGMQRALRTTHRTVPIVSYDSTYVVSARRAAPGAELEGERTEVVIEPENSERRSHRRTRHKPQGYRTVVIEEETQPSTFQEPRPNYRRGSLYFEDMQRQRKDAYKVEVREPQRKDRRRPKSGFWD